MKLIQIYECLCDETRLRILNVLSITPLCVSHLQKALDLPQVKVSKHLTYMKERGLVIVTKCTNQRLYALTQEECAELTKNLKCLQDCSQQYPIFKEDLRRLDTILKDVVKLKEKIKGHV